MLLYLLSPLLIFSFYTLAEKTSLKIFKNKNIFNIFFSSILILTFLYLFSSYSIILKYSLKSLIFILSVFFIIFSINNYKKIISNFNLFFNTIFKNYFFLFFFIFYFFLIYFPAFEEDSLRYHLPIAKRILNQTLFDYHWFDYLTIGTSEFINAIFLVFEFEYTSSFFNFTYLVFLLLSVNYFSKINNNFDENNFLLFLSSPFLISLLTSQKFYIVPTSIAVLSLLYIFINKDKLILKNILIISVAVIFMFVSRANFGTYLVLFFLLSFFYLKEKQEKFYFFLFFILIFLVLYFPIIYIKTLIYNDPFLPIISLNLDNQIWFNEYKFWLTTKQMDFTDSFENIFFKLIVVPFKLIFPFSPSDILKILGVGLLFIFTINFKNKFIKFLTLFMIINVFLYLNFQSRWFLPLLLFLCFVANLNELKIFKKILYIQSICSILIISVLGIHTVLFNFKLIDKQSFFSKYQNFYAIYDYLNKNYSGREIFTNFNNWYNIENSKPIYYPTITIKMDPNFYKKNYKKYDLILWRETGYDGKNPTDLFFTDFMSNYLNCLEFKHLETFYYRNSRNFFKKKNDIVTLYEIKCD